MEPQPELRLDEFEFHHGEAAVVEADQVHAAVGRHLMAGRQRPLGKRARRGREPIVTALNGRDIVDGVADPEKCFTFVAGNPDDMGGVQVAAGYVAPSSTPSYLPNLVTTAESGQRAGVVKVWNMADISPSSHGSMLEQKAMVKAMGSMAAMDMSSSSEDMPATPVTVFRPFGTRRGAVQIASTYQSMLGGQAKPVIAAWQAGREVAFSSIGLDNKPQTQVRKF